MLARHTFSASGRNLLLTQKIPYFASVIYIYIYLAHPRAMQRAGSRVHMLARHTFSTSGRNLLLTQKIPYFASVIYIYIYISHTPGSDSVSGGRIHTHRECPSTRAPECTQALEYNRNLLLTQKIPYFVQCLFSYVYILSSGSRRSRGSNLS